MYVYIYITPGEKSLFIAKVGRFGKEVTWFSGRMRERGGGVLIVADRV